MATLVDDFAALGFELVETHISWVFLGGDEVYKVKKPVRLGFLDFSTLERRRSACEAEVELNTRLAPHVYRGVVPVTRDGAGRHGFGGDGATVDWAVHMQRLPDARRADVLLAAGALDTAAVEALGAHIADFHARMPANVAITAAGSPEAVLKNVTDNFDQTRATVSEHLERAEAREIEAKQVAFVEQHRELFIGRMERGRVRDGHGDLRLEHVYLEDRAITIIDCIEFNERLRHEDVCADIAFLSMDLERLGRVDLAERLLAAYARSSGDYELYRLADFYRGYRAYVRAKVASLLAGDAGASKAVRSRAQAEARRYYLLALSEGRESLLEPVVVAVGGVIGSGKSTISELVAALLAAPVVDTDRTRKSLLGVSPEQRFDDEPWTQAYAPEFSERVYDACFERARHVLASGRSVVLDASFRAKALRQRAAALAAEHGLRFLFVETRAPRETCLERLRERRQAGSVSDGRAEIYDAFAAKWEPVTEIDPSGHLPIDTRGPLEDTARALRERLPAWPPGFTR